MGEERHFEFRLLSQFVMKLLRFSCSGSVVAVRGGRKNCSVRSPGCSVGNTQAGEQILLNTGQRVQRKHWLLAYVTSSY
jgi:hypothetical protein